MFNTSVAKPLILQMNGNRYEFASVQDFSFALAGRASVPGTRITALVKLSTVALHKEAEAIRSIEHLFNDALDGALTDVTSIGPFLQGVDPHSISQDHGWRDLMATLSPIERSFEEFKKIALIKYLQYLAARREAITAIYNDRQPEYSKERVESIEDIHGKMRETAIFNVDELGSGSTDGYSRMPKGETLELMLSDTDVITLLIAKHPCLLKNAELPVFIDDFDMESPLHSGRNIIGRDNTGEAVINAEHRDVSRRHLIIDVGADNTIRLTDISSHGTFISGHYLDNTSI